MTIKYIDTLGDVDVKYIQVSESNVNGITEEVRRTYIISRVYIYSKSKCV